MNLSATAFGKKLHQLIDVFIFAFSTKCKSALNQKFVHHFKMTHFLSNQINHGLYQFGFFRKADDKGNGCARCFLFTIGMIDQYLFDVFLNDITQRGSVGSWSPNMMINLNPDQILFECHRPRVDFDQLLVFVPGCIDVVLLFFLADMNHKLKQIIF